MVRLVRSATLTAALVLLGAAPVSAAVGPCPAQPGHRVFDALEAASVNPGTNEIELDRAVAFPDGSIVAAGGRFVDGKADSVLLRYRPDGSPDPSFGHDGVALLPPSIGINEFVPLVVLADGGLLLGGRAGPRGHSRPAVVRLTRSGALHDGFGDHGVVRLSGIDSLDSLAVGPSGSSSAQP